VVGLLSALVAYGRWRDRGISSYQTIEGGNQ
jgi:hypothetical protein